MASGRMEFHAESIMQHANFAFAIANDAPMPEVRDIRHYDRETCNLILLHGLTGTDTDWLYGGMAQNLSIQYNMNVFMPTVGNNFYLDRGYQGANWCEYVGCELPEYIRKTFRVDMKRENTFIGGLSMGGYGSLHVALAHPDNFGGVLALSSAMIIHEYAKYGGRETDVVPKAMMLDLFGDPKKVEDSDNNPEVQFLKLKAAGATVPRIYLACGTEDHLIIHNRAFASFLEKNGADYIYEEGPGDHNWYFWNEYIVRGLDKLLLSEKA